MIRVTQTFTCKHGKVEGQIQNPPVMVGSLGHSVVLQDRVCFCTGKDLQMERKVEFCDPDKGPH